VPQGVGVRVPPSPHVVVKGKCQGLMFSDFVSPTPFQTTKAIRSPSATGV